MEAEEAQQQDATAETPETQQQSPSTDNEQTES